MTVLLRRRATALREAMDDPGCDAARLRATYAQFARVNRWLAGWSAVFERWLKPRARPGATLLDVGCGGGDVARSLAYWSAEAGVPLAITAVDPDERALDFARSHPTPPGVHFRRASMEELVAEGCGYDFVISNHVLHHLDEAELPRFLEASAALTRGLAVHNDLRRSDLALLAFAPLRVVFHGSFIVPDGLRSIRRAYRIDELRALAPQGWRVVRWAPFRTLVVQQAGPDAGAPG
ncbi:MAG: methyltransferase domain-containing protein [Deinococcales bacterium]